MQQGWASWSLKVSHNLNCPDFINTGEERAEGTHWRQSIQDQSQERRRHPKPQQSEQSLWHFEGRGYASPGCSHQEGLRLSCLCEVNAPGFLLLAQPCTEAPLLVTAAASGSWHCSLSQLRSHCRGFSIFYLCPTHKARSAAFLLLLFLPGSN